jgi:endonuclease/exonuclease/phosphatase family metal-dependent hydrolase
MLAGKGILHVLVHLAGTIPIHVFDTHMQATYNDTRRQSKETRVSQFRQLRKFILKHVVGDDFPVMVLGDFNVNV